jgi:hypothetical protein
MVAWPCGACAQHSQRVRTDQFVCFRGRRGCAAGRRSGGASTLMRGTMRSSQRGITSWPCREVPSPARSAAG